MPEHVLGSTYQPFDKQLAFHQSTKRFKVATSGNRGGKTTVGAEEFVENVFGDLAAGKGKVAKRIGSIHVPRLNYWVVTPTHELGETPFHELLRTVPQALVEKINASTREMWWKGDIHVGFRSTERPERLVAVSLNGVWMDEAPRCKAEAWRGGLRARLADQQGWALFTGSPLGGRNNWVYTDLVSKHGVDPLIGAFSWTTADNPYIPREEIEHAKAHMPPAWYARDWEASWDSFGGSIYDEFRDESHILSESAFRLEFGCGNTPFTAEMMHRIFRRVIAGKDFGWTSPGAMVVVGHLGDTRMVVLEESYGAQRPINGEEGMTTWVSEGKRLMKKWGVQLFTCDTEDPAAIRDLATAGLPVSGAWKNVYHGIRRVSEGLHVVNGRPGLRIMESCVNLIREKRNYQWKALRDQSGFMEEPADGQSDHALDAERYAVVELRPFVASTAEPQRGRVAYR